MTLELVPVASVLTLPAQIPLPAVTWDWADGRLVAVCAHPESLTRRTERVTEPGIQYIPNSTSIHRARVVDLIDRQVVTVSEALAILSDFTSKAYRTCPSQVQIVNAHYPVRHAGFRFALADCIRSKLGAADRLRAHCLFEIEQMLTVDTVPFYREDTHAVIEHADAIGRLVQGRDEAAVPASWYFGKDCPHLPVARADIDAVVALPERLDDLGPIARCIARLSAFLQQTEHRAWMEPRARRTGRRGKQLDDIARHRWDQMLRQIEDVRR